MADAFPAQQGHVRPSPPPEYHVIDDANALAATFATQASVAVANAQAYWEAKGMLMAAQGGGEDEAFDLLVKASPRSNRKLMVIADELVLRAVRRRAGSTPTEEP